MRATLGIPDFSPKIHCISRWTMEGVLANKFQSGRVFLAGAPRIGILVSGAVPLLALRAFTVRGSRCACSLLLQRGTLW